MAVGLKPLNPLSPQPLLTASSTQEPGRESVRVLARIFSTSCHHSSGITYPTCCSLGCTVLGSRCKAVYQFGATSVLCTEWVGIKLGVHLKPLKNAKKQLAGPDHRRCWPIALPGWTFRESPFSWTMSVGHTENHHRNQYQLSCKV